MSLTEPAVAEPLAPIAPALDPEKPTRKQRNPRKHDLMPL